MHPPDDESRNAEARFNRKGGFPRVFLADHKTCHIDISCSGCGEHADHRINAPVILATAVCQWLKTRAETARDLVRHDSDSDDNVVKKRQIANDLIQSAGSSPNGCTPSSG